jgi:hypothetical protein
MESRSEPAHPTEHTASSAIAFSASANATAALEAPIPAQTANQQPSL